MVYLSDVLKSKYSEFHYNFVSELSKNNIPFRYVSPTKDVWLKDYMPLQSHNGNLIQFIYDPPYLNKSQHTISDVNLLCRNLNLSSLPSNLIIDGGNITSLANKTILTDYVLTWNKHSSKENIIRELEKLFETEIIIIPHEPYDFTGHSDGMVRHYKNNTVLINDYSKASTWFRKKLMRVLESNNIKHFTIPYNPSLDNSDDAIGCYINYFKTGKNIFLPVFNLSTDEEAVNRFKELFPDYKIIPVLSNEIAKDGGIINCVTWEEIKNHIID